MGSQALTVWQEGKHNSDKHMWANDTFTFIIRRCNVSGYHDTFGDMERNACFTVSEGDTYFAVDSTVLCRLYEAKNLPLKESYSIGISHILVEDHTNSGVEDVTAWFSDMGMQGKAFEEAYDSQKCITTYKLDRTLYWIKPFEHLFVIEFTLDEIIDVRCTIKVARLVGRVSHTLDEQSSDVFQPPTTTNSSIEASSSSRRVQHSIAADASAARTDRDTYYGGPDLRQVDYWSVYEGWPIDKPEGIYESTPSEDEAEMAECEAEAQYEDRHCSGRHH